MVRIWLFISIVLGFLHTAQAEDIQVGDLVISAPVVREGPPNAPALAGYVTVTNTGQSTDVLVGASTDFAGMSMVHEMAIDDGVMKMKAAETGLTIEPSQTLVLKPGSNHLMFMMLKDRPKNGESVSVVLQFEKAGDVAVSFAVKKAPQ
jgi:hypothetical protein